jgi:hypothetical protein
MRLRATQLYVANWTEFGQDCAKSIKITWFLFYTAELECREEHFSRRTAESIDPNFADEFCHISLSIKF